MQPQRVLTGPRYNQIKRPALRRPFRSPVCRKRSSVPRDGRAAKAVVDTGSDHIDVLADTINASNDSGGPSNPVRDHREVAISHEQMVVLDANRPVRCKAVFQT